jgi:hypothetical protein
MPWIWGTVQEDAFLWLRDAMGSEEVLALPVSRRKFHLEMDRSRWALGAVLSQEQEEVKF